MLYTNEKVPIRFPHGPELTRGWLDQDSDRAQRVLIKHAAERPMCGCTPEGVLMHIVRRNGRYHLATMPGRSHHHALSCPSYTPDPRTSALRFYSDQAIWRSANRINLEVSHEAVTGPPFDHFSPSAVFELLWELAGLNVSTPKTVATRKHYFVGKSLAEACAAIRLNRETVFPYIPLATSMTDECTHLIARVRRLDRSKFGCRVLLSADRETTCWISHSSWVQSRVDEHFGSFETPTRPNGHWIFAKLWRSPKGNVNLFDVGCLEITDTYLPVRNDTRDIISQLVEDQRRFFVCPRLDAQRDSSSPIAVLLDLDEPHNLLPATLPQASPIS